MVAVVIGVLVCAVGLGSALWSARQVGRPPRQRTYDRMGAALLVLSGVMLIAYPLPTALGLSPGYYVLTRIAGAALFIVAVAATLAFIERRAK